MKNATEWLVIVILFAVFAFVAANTVYAETLPTGRVLPGTGPMTCSCDRQEYLNDKIYGLHLIAKYAPDAITDRELPRILMWILMGKWDGFRGCR